ncbi:hypothetical protein HCN44_006678 [Aphidius gifuensis]|uniref:EMI domain-containing protein n=1 Tax=Aphidius gifuensis TaxID=684658 RepID=A0A834Y099_APHGI|nr:uncharacterized protein LOC122850002 [Aphidius gifuensis]XP_044004888.1 uncharacterized protein LOC122850002 [Aphidius gifuensis]KAF7995571.1 hypothetical protein HCN44_006678 [Aphidius gifuensis]
MGLSWQLKYSDLVIVLVLIITSSSEPLTGENLCQRTENYTVTWTESYKEYVPVYTTTWCMSMPPKCMKSHQELRTRHRIKTEVRHKNVTECCDGFASEKLTIDNENNFVINCVAIPQCKAGFIGKNCSAVCPQGTWGIYCKEACNCSNQRCDPISGSCQCPPGWTGSSCTDKCKVGKWGSECKSNCSCPNESKICHHVTGNCSEVIESINKLSEIVNNNIITDVFDASTSTISTLSTGTINDDDSINIISIKNHTNEFFNTTNSKNNGANEVNVTTSRNEIELNSNFATTTINKFQEHTTSQDIRVIKVNKSTSRPILAVVHVSGKTLTEHDKMIITPEVHTVPLSLEIVAIIVIGCMMSLGLMIMVVLALLHIRTKLFETIRLSIYDTAKLDNHETTLTHQHQKLNDEIKFQSLRRNNRISCQPSDYETPRCIIPDRPLTLPRAISTISTLTRESTYSNQFPNIQLFNSPRELLEAHYDRPPATNTFRQLSFPGHNEGEHLYDEIPLRSTMLRKYHNTLQ